jgi:hypothetical protein
MVVPDVLVLASAAAGIITILTSSPSTVNGTKTTCCWKRPTPSPPKATWSILNSSWSPGFNYLPPACFFCVALKIVYLAFDVHQNHFPLQPHGILIMVVPA